LQVAGPNEDRMHWTSRPVSPIVWVHAPAAVRQLALART